MTKALDTITNLIYTGGFIALLTFTINAFLNS